VTGGFVCCKLWLGNTLEHVAALCIVFSSTPAVGWQRFKLRKNPLPHSHADAHTLRSQKIRIRIAEGLFIANSITNQRRQCTTTFLVDQQFLLLAPIVLDVRQVGPNIGHVVPKRAYEIVP